MTSTFTEEQELKYCENRLYGSNAKPEQIKAIYRYDGFLPSELRAKLAKNGAFSIVLQENPREPFYLQNETIHIPQFSGTGRARRYQRLMERNKELRGKTEIQTFYIQDDYRKTLNNYSNMAYDFATGLFIPSTDYENKRVFSGTDIKDLRIITFGSVDSFAKQLPVLSTGMSEYLKAQITSLAGEKALNLGYTYADQAGLLIEKILKEYEGLAVNSKKMIELNLFMLGRVGGLEEGMKRHGLVFPTGIINETDLAQNNVFLYPMHNIMAEGKRDIGYNFNVKSVLDETVEQLAEAKKHGCACIDLELRESVEEINRARRRYDNIKINFGFVGYVSDLPLIGDTLADELDSDKGEEEAVKEIIKTIERRKDEVGD